MPLALLLIGGAALAFFLFRSQASASSSSSSPDDGSDVAPDPSQPLAPPQGPPTQEYASGAFHLAANGATTRAPGVMLPRAQVTRRPPQDLGSLEQNPRYTTAAERAAIARNAPRGWIPHMVMNEGEVTYRGGHPGKMVKLVRPGVGPNTVWVRTD